MHALSVAVKSSPAVWYAAADPDEFMIVHHDDSPDAALDTLEQAIGLVGARDRAMPRIVRFSRGEFLRLLRVGVAFRVRALALEPIKGRLLDRPMAAGPAG